MSIQRFEDLIARQLARDLVVEIYSLSEASLLQRDYDITRQIRRAAISTMSNIAEGYDRHTHADFFNFLVIANGSVSEVRSLLHVYQALGFINNGQFLQIEAKTMEIGRLLGGLKRSLKLPTKKPKPSPSDH